METKRIEYESVRKDILDGDVLLYKGSGLISRLVKWFTRSEYSHAGLAVWWNDRLMVMEAVGKGVVVTPLSRNVEHYPGDVDWYWCKRPIDAVKRKELILFAQKELGKSFSRWGLLLIGIYILLRRRFDENDAFYTSRKLFCSFYVAQAYNQIGLDLKEGRNDCFTTPDDLAHSPLLVKKGALKKDGVIRV